MSYRKRLKIVTALLLALSLLFLTGCRSAGIQGKDLQLLANPPTPTPMPTPEPEMTPAELDKLLEGQELRISGVQYIVQDEQYKALYPDLLGATLENHTQDDIQNAIIVFAAWDKNRLPVELRGQVSLSSAYALPLSADGINLIPGDSYTGEFRLRETNGISFVKAIVKEYTTFDGETWTNPYYEKQLSLYEKKKLPEDAIAPSPTPTKYSSIEEFLAADSSLQALEGSLAAEGLPIQVTGEGNALVFSITLPLNETIGELYANQLAASVLLFGADALLTCLHLIQEQTDITEPVFTLRLLSGGGTVLFSDTIDMEGLETFSTGNAIGLGSVILDD